MILTENTIFDGRYKLLRMLGRGGSSEVWLAEDELSGLQVAVKVYAPGVGLDENGVQAFSEEFKLVFNLNHTNLLRPTYYAIYDRMPYLVMPYVKNGSSLKYIGEFTEEQAWRFLRDVASGLEYLHNRIPPVIHQDIKPDNILVDDDGDFLITDFGISTKMRSTLPANSTTTVSMTMAYAAPERWSRKNRPVMSGDIWALGASVFELLTGYPPYGELGGRLQYDGAEIPEMEGNWSEELIEIVERCLQRETADRPTSGEVVSICKAHFDREIVPEPKLPRGTTHIGKQTVSFSKQEGISTHNPQKEPTSKKEKQSKPISKQTVMRRTGDGENIPLPGSSTVRMQDVADSQQEYDGHQSYTDRRSFDKNKKWYVIVLAGILLLAIGYFIFGNKKTPTGISDDPIVPKVEEPFLQPDDVIDEVVDTEEPKATTAKPPVVVEPVDSPKTNQSECLDKGNKCFNEGNYVDAVDYYRKSGDKVQPARLKAAEECASSRKMADELFSQQKMEGALIEYRKILSHNPFDKYVKQRVEECEKQINTIQP